jgi:hypothetical protein
MRAEAEIEIVALSAIRLGAFGPKSPRRKPPSP